jgi:hypothetical protein
MKVRDLNGWPPEPGAAYKTSYTVPSSEGSMVENFIAIFGDNVCFTGIAKGNQHTYDFKAPNEKSLLISRRFLNRASERACF